MELKHLKEMKRVYDLNIKDLDREELETLAEINYALQCAINGVVLQSEQLHKLLQHLSDEEELVPNRTHQQIINDFSKIV